ncbi:MAG: hypothetical protein IKH88_10470 [Prevotella sp.]|nr:hypothetical protein [Prevotella sp.]
MKAGWNEYVSAMGSLLVVSLLAFAACTKHRGGVESLAKAESQMNLHPDSALAILDSLESSSKGFSEEKMESLCQTRTSALQKGDTITSILALAKQSEAYEQKGHLDSALTVTREAFRMLQERYDDSRHVENEQRLMLSSERKDKLILVIIFIFIINAVAVITLYHHKRRKREEQLREYRKDVERLRQLKSEMAELVQRKEVATVTPSHRDAMQEEGVEEMRERIRDLTEKLNESERLTSEAISAKDEEIERLTAKNRKYDKFFANKTRDDIVKAIRKSDIVRQLEFNVEHPLHTPSSEDWDRLDQLFHRVHPNFPATLQGRFKLTTNEYRVCQLIFSGISPKGIAILMDYDKSNVTNMRKRLLTKLTGMNGKAKEFDDYLFSIPFV